MTQNRLILFVGTSASGKTTIARSVAREEEATLILVSSIIRERAKEEGYTSLRAFFKKYGIKGAFEKAREKILNQIIDRLKKNKVVVEGVYDHELFQEMVKRVGRKNMTIVNVAGNRSARKHRIGFRTNIGRSEATKKLKERDAIKWGGGLLDVLRNADFIVRGNTPSEAVAQYRLRKRRLR